MTHSEIRIFYDHKFFNSSDVGFRSKKVLFLKLSVDQDPHIFGDPDPGSQNLAYPTDPGWSRS